MLYSTHCFSSIHLERRDDQTMTYAILWDLDGTIADTTALHFRSWQEILGAEGIDHTYEEFIDGFGRSNAEILPIIFGAELSRQKIARISDAKEAAFRRLARGQTTTLPGVGEWLARFHAARVPQTISSSAPMANIMVMVDALGMADYFWALVSGFPLPKGKPDPDIFLRSAAAVKVAPSACVVFEDSIHGVEAARRAGMACVALGERMVDALPSIVADGLNTPILAVDSLVNLSWDQFVSLTQPG